MQSSQGMIQAVASCFIIVQLAVAHPVKPTILLEEPVYAVCAVCV